MNKGDAMRSGLLTLYRSLTRHRLYSVLNIGGLGLGIAVFLVLFLFVRFETGFDRGLPGSDKLWIVNRTLSFPGVPTVDIPTRAGMLADLKADYPQTVGTRMRSVEVAVPDGASSAKRMLAEVDGNYFALFPFPVVAGNPTAALADPAGAVVTESTARTFLGTGTAVGRTLTTIADGKPRIHRVGAIIRDLPADVTHRHDIFVALPGIVSPDPYAPGVTTFLRFPDAAAARVRAAQLDAFVARHPDPAFGPDIAPKVAHALMPLGGLHLARPSDRAIVTALGIVGVLALLVAVVNTVNLATARSTLRAREVALRKVVGASRGVLIRQFLAEALTAAATAGLIGLALTELALPFVNAVGGTTLAISYSGPGSILPSIGLLVLVVGLLSGMYPAFVLSRFQPAAVLASARAPGGARSGARLRSALVVGQFAIAIALMIGTAVLLAQAQHLQRSDLGFGRTNLIVVPSFNHVALDVAQRNAFAVAATSVPGVAAVTRASLSPAKTSSFWIGRMRRDGPDPADVQVIQGDVGAGFFPTYGARLIAGRFFDPAYAADEATADETRRYNLILNRTAVVRLGFASPADAIGRTIRVGTAESATIIGVVADMRFRSPRDPVDPHAYYQRDRTLGSPVLALRFKGEARFVMDRLATEWRRIAPAVPYAAMTVEQALYEDYYRADVQRSRLFLIGAALAVAIGCIGLYGLAAFDTERRIKEIGIRKTLGASTRDILRLLIGQYMRPVFVANLIAWPLGWAAARQWLSGFDDRAALSPSFFVGATLVAVAVAVFTVGGRAWRVARAEPAAALRYE